VPLDWRRGEDLTAEGTAFVELTLSRERVLLGEPVELLLRFGFEQDFLATNLVPLFRRTLDLPVQVLAPALEGPGGLRLLDAPEHPRGTSFALGESVARAARAQPLERDGRTFRVFELRRRAVPLRAGTLELAAPVLVFAHATRFEDDFLQGRRALDRREGFVRGASARLVVAPPPEDGRPADYCGAIGDFTLEATARPQDLELGASLELTVSIRARAAGGALGDCPEPRLELPDWVRQRGVLVERGPGSLTARYDLLPLADGAHDLPVVRFVSYTTTPPAGYRTLESDPIPIVVRARAAEETEQPETRDRTALGGGAPGTAAPAPDARSGNPVLLATIGVLLATLVLGLLLLRRRTRDT